MQSRRSGRVLPQGGVLLLPAATLAVHQLRYSLAYGSRANAELAAQGHSYLHSLVPWTIFALGVGAGLFLRRAAAALRTGEPRARRSSAAFLWLAAWAGLLAIYAVQETLEATLLTGHPGGVAGIFGHGGWWAVPTAAVIAGLVTALLLVGRVLLRLAAAVGRVRFARENAVRIPPGVAGVAVRPLARAAAGRAPPPAPAPV